MRIDNSGAAPIDLASPGAIGGTTPAAGAFTALAAQSLGLTGQSVSGSASTNLVDLAATWNTTGTPVGIKLNVANTASGANARLLQLQTGGTTRFDVSPTGGIYSYNDASNTFTLQSAASATTLQASRQLQLHCGSGWAINLFASGGQLYLNAPTLAFFGTSGGTKPTITGSRGGNAALADLLTKLAGLGLLTDSTT